MTNRVLETAAVVVIAIICARCAVSADTIERVYSTDWYLRIQAVLTTASNTIPIAWLDIARRLPADCRHRTGDLAHAQARTETRVQAGT